MCGKLKTAKSRQLEPKLVQIIEQLPKKWSEIMGVKIDQFDRASDKAN